MSLSYTGRRIQGKFRVFCCTFGSFAEDVRRLEKLAKLRNVALTPLWKNAAKYSRKEGLELSEQDSGWPADRVIFVNDVYLCAKDIIRLIYHNADMACGLDFFIEGDDLPVSHLRPGLLITLDRLRYVPSPILQSCGLLERPVK